MGDFLRMVADKNDGEPDPLEDYSDCKKHLHKPIRTTVSVPPELFQFAAKRASRLFKGKFSKYVVALIRRDVAEKRKKEHADD